jgi:hypothetical protein
MSHVDDRIKIWRSRLASTDHYTRSDMDELESHIHEEMKRLKKKGLTEEESFHLAVHRLGSMEGLGKEFAKVNSGLIWKNRILWMLGGYFFIHFLMFTAKIAQTAYFLTVKWGYIKTPIFGPQFPIPIIPIPLTLLLAGCLYFLLTRNARKGKGLSDRLLKKTHLLSFLLFCCLITTIIGYLSLSAVLVKVTSAETFGRMGVANTLFEFVWNFFLAGSLTILVFRSLRHFNRCMEAASD